MLEPSDSEIPSLETCAREIVRDVVKHCRTEVYIHNLFTQSKF